jgi:molybdate transport system substrate-binding protein
MIEFIRRRVIMGSMTLAIIATMVPHSAAIAEKPAKAPAHSSETVTAPVVFAAASLKTALDEIGAAWHDTGKPAPLITYASSAVLAKQIEQGAPADVFISANLRWMDYLSKAKLIKEGTRRNLLGNRLVLIEPADRETNLEIASGFDLAGAAGDEKIAVCTVASCPAGIYAKEALENLGVWDSVEPKLAQAQNVRAALALVSRGEARFGIVYATDAKAEPKVRVIGTFPEKSHKPIVYPVAIVETSKNPEAVRFVAFLTSQAATKILKEQGFTILSK